MHGRTFIHLIQRYYPFRGGSEQYFQALSERLAAAGANVHVLTTDAWDLEYFWNPDRRRIEIPFERHNGVKIHRLATRHLPLPNFTHRAIRRGMGELARLPVPGRDAVLKRLSHFGPWLPDLPAVLDRTAGDADLIHAANIALESMIASSVGFARERDIPVVITPKLHLGEGPGSTVRRYYTMPHQIALLQQADAIMTQTSIEAAFLESAGVPGERMHVVGLGIDREAVTGGDVSRARSAIELSGRFVLALGAAAFDKGTVHACEAIIKMNRSRSEPISIVVAGPIMSNFQSYVDQLPEHDRRNVIVLGYVTDELRTDLLAACELLTLASRTEAFGYVFLESWANGKPVVGARAGGIPAVVSDGRDGLLVEFGDVDGLANAFGELVDNPELASTLGESGCREKVVDTEEWYQKVVGVYGQVLGVRVAESEARSAVQV